jgi:hypothetical protein
MLLQQEIITVDVTWSRASGRVLAIAFLELHNMQINY